MDACAFADTEFDFCPKQIRTHTHEIGGVQRKPCVTNPQNELVNLEKFIPGIELSIGYATTNNFTGTKIYNLARAYARKPVAEALKNIQADLKKQGLELKIFDGIGLIRQPSCFTRPIMILRMWPHLIEVRTHNRGCALDLTIIDSKTRKELEMPTGWDSFKKDAWPSTPVADPN
jgi:D-alanyl-D-alanine dipeptidase